MVDLNAEPRQQLQGDGDVGLGNQLTHHFNVYGGLGGDQGQRHEQRCEELARHIPTHLDGLVQCQCRNSIAVRDAQRRVAGIAQVIDVAAQLPQGIHQVANGAFVHARHAREFKLATQQRQRSGQWAHGRACIAHEQAAGRHGLASTQAGNAHRAA